MHLVHAVSDPVPQTKSLPQPDPPFEEGKKDLNFLWKFRSKNVNNFLHAKPLGVGQGIMVVFSTAMIMSGPLMPAMMAEEAGAE